jgi:hypothetical protein
VPAGQQQEERLVVLKLQAVVLRRMQRPCSPPRPALEPMRRLSRERTCAHPPSSRIHLRRRRIPRMRDDLGDP